MVTLAHISDVHLAPLPRPAVRELLGKRLIGYLNWQRSRKAHHVRGTLDALVADMRAQDPDHIAVTGDLINLALEREYHQARAWLEGLGPPERVTAIPGNHDLYVPVAEARGLAHWRSYMQSDTASAVPNEQAESGFPFTKSLGEVVLIGLSSAIATAPFVAAGALGARQLEALAGVLRRLRAEDRCRVVLVHHPPVPGLTTRRRGLRDAAELQAVLEAEGAELVLYGHDHVHRVDRLDSATGPIPLVCVPSGSAGRAGCRPLARYNLYEISRQTAGWQVTMTSRGLRTPGGAVGEIAAERLTT